MNRPAPDTPLAKLALKGHLERVETNLCASRTPRAERDEILASIVAQYNDRLGKPYAEALPEEVDQSLAALAPPQSYATVDELGFFELLRQLGRRLVPSAAAVPVAIKNESGQRKILWGVLTPRLVVLGILLICGGYVTHKLIMPGKAFLSGFNLSMYAYMIACIFGGIIWKLKRTPVEQLPRMDEVESLPLRASAWRFALMFLVTCALILFMIVPVYMLLGWITRQPLWPYSPDLFAAAFIGIAIPLWAGSIVLAWFHRRSLKRLETML